MSLRQQLDRRILAFIRSAGRSEPFERLALDLFAWQYQRNRVYRACCDQAGRTPADVTAWRDIPAVWPVAWRLAEFRGFPAGREVAVFLSSGTTQARMRNSEFGMANARLRTATSRPGRPSRRESDLRSRHAFDTLELYRASMARPFADALLPAGRPRVPILVLMPSPEESPHSSLSFMMGQAVRQFGAPGESGFFVRSGRVLLGEFAAAVRRGCRSGGPMVLASTALGWVTALERLGSRRFALPPGSRIMETGGYKGRTVQWPRARLYRLLSERFALPADQIVSEYGMCELSSQFYSRPDAGPAKGRPDAAGEQEPVCFAGPPWTRVLAIDPESQRPVPAGQPGLLRVIDLANRGSCLAVQTEDLVIAAGPRRFWLLGRAPLAPPRGCSLAAEDLHAVRSQGGAQSP